MSYIEQTIGSPFMQLAYESFSTDVKQVDAPIPTGCTFSQLAYEFFSTDVKSTYLGYPFALNELYMRTTYNPILFAFLGKAWLFNGSSLTDFGSPIVAIYPMIATDGSRIVAGGGMEEDGSVSGDVYGFGFDMYYLTADRDYLAVVVPTDVVYLIDSSGNTVTSTKQLSVVPFMKGWRLASRSYFYAVVMKLL
jgi:hypothetical protein